MRTINHIDTTQKGKVASLKPLLPYLRPYRKLMVIALVALICSSGAVLSLGQGLKMLVDNGIAQKDAATLDRALRMLLGIILLLAAATYARFYCVTKIGEGLVAAIRRDIYRHLIHLSPAFYESRRVGEILSRITSDTTVLQVVVGSTLSVAARNTLLLIGGLAMLIISSAKLAAYIAILVPLVVAPILILGHRVRRYAKTAQHKIADISAFAEETLHGIRTVQAYAREPMEDRLFGSRVETAFAAAMVRVRARALLTALVILLVFGAIGVLLWAGGHEVLKGNLTSGELSSFIFYAVLVASAVGALSEVVGDIQHAAGAAEDLMELRKTESAVQEPVTPVALPAGAADLNFDNVTFHYPSRPETAALENFSFTVKAGETVALAGPSGAGKSTVLQLLLRFYDPQEGAVRIGNADIRQASLHDLRRRFAYVSQDPMIFSASAAENIAYGRPDATRAEIEAAAKAACAHDFITALPEGFDTYLGERGVRISGGEKQRIAIARALLKDPEILLLDEATSALDAENERLVQQALETLMKGRTTLVIAHRLTTIQNAHKILLLENGRLAATGTHKELLADNALYQKLARSQFSE